MNNTLPLALRSPDPAILLRPVRMADLDSLYHDCWHDRAYNTLHQLLTRARRMEHYDGGIGVVISAPAGQHPPVRGFGLVTAWTDSAEITDVVVAPGFRGRGLGTALMQHLTGHARRLGLPRVELGVLARNTDALRLYHRLGFRHLYTDYADVLLNERTGDLRREQVIHLMLPLI